MVGLIKIMRQESQFQERCIVYDANGSDRLLLQLVRVPPSKEDCWNFHQLVWETRFGKVWKTVASVSAQDIQGEFPRRRWAADIANFIAETGRAILLVGEYGEPDSTGAIRAKYSRWECDVADGCLLGPIEDASPRSDAGCGIQPSDSPDAP